MRNKYSDQFKLQVVKQCLRGGLGIEELAHQLGLDYSMVRRWLEHYRQHGVRGLRKKYTRRSAAFKLQVLEAMWRDGLSQRRRLCSISASAAPLADGSFSTIVVV